MLLLGSCASLLDVTDAWRIFFGNDCVATEFESLQDRSFVSLLKEPQDFYHVLLWPYRAHRRMEWKLEKFFCCFLVGPEGC